MSALKLYLCMEKLAQSPALSFFQHYREDLTVHDRRELVEWGDTGFQYLWIVRDSGTHLFPLGVHPKINEAATATLVHVSSAIRRGLYKVFAVSDASGVVEIDVPKASQLLRSTRYHYEVLDGMVFRCRPTREPLANMHIRYARPHATDHGWHAQFQSRRAPNHKDLCALRLIAQCEVSSAAHSLLQGPSSIVVDDKDIGQAIAAARGQLLLEAA